MEKLILKFKLLNPNVGFYTLSETFGSSITKLMEILEIESYYIIDDIIIILDDNGNKKYEEYSDGKWFKYKYNKEGVLIYEEHSNKFWVKMNYNENGVLMNHEFSGGRIYVYEKK